MDEEVDGVLRIEDVAPRFLRDEGLPPRIMAAIERAYRRGYHQGFFAASKAAHDGVPQKRVERFFVGKLHKWRYSSAKKCIQPPEIV